MQRSLSPLSRAGPIGYFVIYVYCIPPILPRFPLVLEVSYSIPGIAIVLVAVSLGFRSSIVVVVSIFLVSLSIFLRTSVFL